MFILGISAFYHDSAACLIKNGEIIAAAQEERFSRIKHDHQFPLQAIAYCLDEAKIDGAEVDNVVFYEKPFLKFERLLETYLAFAPRGFSSFASSMPLWIKEKLFQKNQLIQFLETALSEDVVWKDKLLFSDHHLSHAASAFFPSPFETAAILTIDGVGEWTSTSICLGDENKINPIKDIQFPHSLGLLYSAFTYYCGFKVNSGEYKLMGLAPYGSPIYADKIKNNVIDISEDGSFRLNMAYFKFTTDNRMTNTKFDDLFGGKVRPQESNIEQRHMDLAASVQHVTEEVILKIAHNIANETGAKNLCLAGGVALNCVANGVLRRAKIFENIWVQPAAGDAGGALGAALAAWHIHHEQPRTSKGNSDQMKGTFLGPSFSTKQIAQDLKDCGANFHQFTEEELLGSIAKQLTEGKAVGWMQGRMEFGPRALGRRSIIADPRSPKMQKQLNLKVKYRESFRPFAPSVLSEEVENWFVYQESSPYMLMVAKVKEQHRLQMDDHQQSLFGIEKLNVPKSSIPAVTHVDYSARIQTVHKETNPRYHALIKKFFDLTGVPILVNTSFNVRGEPIICNPHDAFRCFMGTDLDILVVEDFVMFKDEQNLKLLKKYEGSYELD